MNVSQLISRIRNQIDDRVEPYLWENDELLDYLNEAYIDFCRETEIIHDSRTPTGYRQLCTITLQADVSSYTLNKKILTIKSAILSDKTIPLIKATASELDTIWYGWRTSKGTPRFFVLDMTAGKILLVPYPTATEIGNGLKLYLEVTRLPLTLLSFESNNEPEFAEEFHQYLIPYAIMKAYEKDDVQTRRPDLAQKYRLLYMEGVEKTKRRFIKSIDIERVAYVNRGLL